MVFFFFLAKYDRKTHLIFALALTTDDLTNFFIFQTIIINNNNKMYDWHNDKFKHRPKICVTLIIVLY